MNQEVQSSQINNILTKCWADESFKQKLLADPTATLKAEGVEIPAAYTIQVLENTDKVVNYVLPPNPNSELSDSELEAVAGGIVAFDPSRGLGGSTKGGSNKTGHKSPVIVAF